MFSARRNWPLASLLALALALLSSAAPARAAAPRPAHATPASARPPTSRAAVVRNLILMIPDGCGPASIALGRMCAGHPLSLDSMLVGACETGSTSSRVTDSAAGATAYASGIKTANVMLGLDPAERPVGTLLEAAQARGMKTALVVTSRITHATPAAFASHIPDRSLEDSIAVQELDHRVDLMFGGGRDNFLPRGAGGQRPDGRDLIARARGLGYQIVTNREEFLKPLELPVLGLFASDHMSYEINRNQALEPSLAEMTRTALALLAPSPRGFFVMIEGSRIDHAAHDNDPATHAGEVMAYDLAVREALAFARRDRHTLVVSVSDHECGGLSLGRGLGGDTSPYAFHPEVLLRAHASAEEMANRIRAGNDPARVLAQGTGLDSIGVDEIAGVRDTTITVKRRIVRIGEIESRRALAGWTSLGHSAVDVGLYAFGPGSDQLRGVHENDEVGRILARLAGLDLDAVTARLRGQASRAPSRQDSRGVVR